MTTRAFEYVWFLAILMCVTGLGGCLLYVASGCVSVPDITELMACGRPGLGLTYSLSP